MQIRVSVICIALSLSACDRNTQNNMTQPLPQVSVVTLHSQPVALHRTLPGRTVAVRTAEVRPQVDGIIQKRLFTEGSEVRAGQQLYQIDPATYQAAYDKALATLNNDQATVRRYRVLVADHAVSEQTYDDAVASAAEAKADLDTARVNLNYTRVLAPISGRIGRSLFTEGALVTSGQTSYLTTITQLDPIYVDVSESARSLLELRNALASGRLKALNGHEAAVQLTLEDGSVYPLDGRLEFSEVNVDEGTGSVTLRATFPNPGRILLPGMFVHAVMKQAIEEHGILVPQEAVSHDTRGRPWVYIVDKNNIARLHLITTEGTINGNWLVTAGLHEGDRVITQGLLNVHADSKVIPQEVPADTTPPASDVQLSMTDASAQ